MATYTYRCERDGVFDVSRPIGTAPKSVACPACGGKAQRVISVPMIRCGTRSLYSAAIERAEKSRYEPEVVTSVPSAGAVNPVRWANMTPALARLPRP
jgi:putative FmdB family regulatory protein